jgi:hypothetical protein
MFVLAVGFLIGYRFVPTRVVLLPETEKRSRKYRLQPDGSIPTGQYDEGSAELGVPLRTGRRAAEQSDRRGTMQRASRYSNRHYARS